MVEMKEDVMKQKKTKRVKGAKALGVVKRVRKPRAEKVIADIGAPSKEETSAAQLRTSDQVHGGKADGGS
jgi:hypothetical protein